MSGSMISAVIPTANFADDVLHDPWLTNKFGYVIIHT
jgi:hypothetical protein